MHKNNKTRFAAIAAAVFVTLNVSAQTNAPATPPEPKPKWDTSAAAGLTLTRGNSDTVVFTANILANRKGTPNEWSLGADATYGENNSVKNNESLHGFVQYNRLVTERFYGYARADLLHDEIADVKYRLTVSPGVGYYFIKNDKTTLSGEVGPGFIYERQGGKEKSYLTLRVGEKFEHKFTAKTRVWQSLEILPQVDHFKNTIVIGEVGVEAGLTEKLSLRSYIQDTYDNEPAPGREKNDLKLVTAIAYKF